MQADEGINDTKRYCRAIRMEERGHRSRDEQWEMDQRNENFIELHCIPAYLFNRTPRISLTYMMHRKTPAPKVLRAGQYRPVIDGYFLSQICCSPHSAK